MEFLRDVATRTGTDINETGRAFLGLAAATKGTAVEGEPTRQVFEAVANAMAKAGRSAVDTERALLAISQIASKGTVSMEELRGQLGEALPGALQAAANGLGITTADLIKLVENGQIAADDLFPALTKGLNELYAGGTAGAQTLSQEIANVKNAFIELAADLGESGGFDALKAGAEGLAAALVLSNVQLVAVGKTIGAVLGAISTGNFSLLKEAFAEIEREARDKLLKTAQHNKVLAGVIEVTGTEATKAALAQQQQAAAAEAAGKAAEKQTAAVKEQNATYVSLSTTFAKVREDLGKQIETAEKAKVAREAESKAAVQLAQAFGTEGEQRRVAADAAAKEAAALTKVAELRLTDVNVLQGELNAKRAFLEEQGKISEQRQKELDDLQKTINLRQAEADKAIAQAQASRVAAAAAQAESEAQKDNSLRVNELKNAYQDATNALIATRKAKEENRATTAEVEQAELKAGKAALLYRDALKDQTEAIKAKQSAAKADTDLQSTVIQLAIEQQKAVQEVAKARGDEATAIQAAQNIRQLEIQLLELQAQAKRAEAEAALASIEVRRAELELSGKMTEAQRLELDAATRKAQVLLKQAEISEVTARKMRDLAQANAESGNSARNAASDFDKEAAALYGIADAANAAALAELRRRRGKDANGFSIDGQGNTISAGGQLTTRIGIANFLKSAGVTDQNAALAIASQFADSQGNIPYVGNPGQRMYGGDTMSMAVLRAAEQWIYNNQRTGGAAAAGAAGGAGAGAQSGTPVNIVINGSRRTVNVASASDASALASILQQLENDRARG